MAHVVATILPTPDPAEVRAGIRRAADLLTRHGWCRMVGVDTEGHEAIDGALLHSFFGAPDPDLVAAANCLTRETYWAAVFAVAEYCEATRGCADIVAVNDRCVSSCRIAEHLLRAAANAWDPPTAHPQMVTGWRPPTQRGPLRLAYSQEGAPS